MATDDNQPGTDYADTVEIWCEHLNQLAASGDIHLLPSIPEWLADAISIVEKDFSTPYNRGAIRHLRELQEFRKDWPSWLEPADHIYNTLPLSDRSEKALNYLEWKCAIHAEFLSRFVEGDAAGAVAALAILERPTDYFGITRGIVG